MSIGDFADPATNLASKKAAATALSYPLSGGNEYAGRLVFHIVDEEAEKPATLRFGDVSTLQQQLGGLGDEGAGVDDPVNRLQSTETKSAVIQSTSVAKEPKVLAGRKVSLYLPQALQIQDAAAYDTNFELGRLGAGAENAMRLDGDINKIVSDAVGSVGNMVNSLREDGISNQQARLISQQLSRFVPGTAVPTLASGVLGFATNPNVRALFRTVPLRAFSFSFSLVPTSAAEAEEIKAIIKFFRTELYPESLSTAGVAIGYKFPNRFVIRAQYRSQEIPGIKFLPMYLQAFNAVYNPSGMGMHSDGNFSEYTITMSFTEAKALSRQDVEQGGY